VLQGQQSSQAGHAATVSQLDRNRVGWDARIQEEQRCYGVTYQGTTGRSRGRC
jgi:hypothetical protein